jgi:general secretion pathway protein F
MLAVGAATVVFILTFVMPKIATIFAGTTEHLPLPTQIVMSVSAFLKIFWLPLFGAVALMAIMLKRWGQTPQGRIKVGQALLGLPLIRELIIKADLARFARTLNLLLQSGLPLVRAIEVAAGTIDSPQIRVDMFVCAEGLTAGENLGNCLKRSVYFPELFVQALAVAEEGGELSSALADIAESCEAEVNEAVKVVTTLLEPAMILAVGSIVGFIIFAMLLPIFSMDIMAR